jgi:hypothetical protein
MWAGSIPALSRRRTVFAQMDTVVGTRNRDDESPGTAALADRGPSFGVVAG